MRGTGLGRNELSFIGTDQKMLILFFGVCQYSYLVEQDLIVFPQDISAPLSPDVTTLKGQYTVRHCTSECTNCGEPTTSPSYFLHCPSFKMCICDTLHFLKGALLTHLLHGTEFMKRLT